MAKSGLDQVIKFDKDSPTAAILGKTSIKRKELLKLFWYGKGAKKGKDGKWLKSSATGNSIHKLGLAGKTGDTVKYKNSKGKMSTARGGQVIHSGKDDLWTEFANGKKKIAMQQLMTLAGEDIILSIEHF